MADAAAESIKARRGRCTDARIHLDVGILPVDVGLGEVGEVVQVQDKRPRAVPVHVAALSPGEGGGPLGQPLVWTGPPTLSVQLDRRAGLCIYNILQNRREKKDGSQTNAQSFAVGGACWFAPRPSVIALKL